MSKAKAAQARVFVPLRKVDEEQRLVYGTITQEILDKSGEMMDYVTSKPNFEKWSGDIDKATGGLSKGNVRVMHGMTAAGKLTDIAYDDDAQTIDVCAKIVDNNEWEKVLEGVYTGFSVGGSYEKKWTADGVKKFTAMPMEVSIVDNPCVPTATFQFNKADGSSEAIMFKVAAEALGEEAEADDRARVEASANLETGDMPKNEDVVAKATAIAEEAADGSTWMDHVTDARDQLMKASSGKAKKATEEGGDPKPKEPKDEEAKDDKADGKTGDKEAGKDSAKSDGDKSEKVTAPGIMQKWVTTDGEGFEKKADAEAHEATLTPAAEVDEDDAAAKLKKALGNAVAVINAAGTTVDVEDSVFTNLDRMHKAFVELDQPREADGAPKLEKGMYTVRRFADLLGTAADLTRTIKAEGVLEGGDEVDNSVSEAVKGTLTTLGENFITYATQQVTELMAGIDTDTTVVGCYDYYYRAAQADPDNVLAKDCAELLDKIKDDVPETIETMAKAWAPGSVLGTTETVGDDDLAKRHDELQKRYDSLEKVANEAAEGLGTLAKRVEAIEKTPLPRSPSGYVAEKGSDHFFGKAETHEDKLTLLNGLLKEHGADGLATLMIKASQQSGGQQMTLRS